MASVRRKRGSKFWFACFSTPTGERKQVSTKATDKKEAMKIAWAAEEAARRQATATQARKIISDLVKSLHGTPVSNVTCSKFFAGWKKRRSAEVGEASMSRFEDVEKSLAEYFGKGWDRPLCEVTEPQIAEWRNGLCERVGVGTVNTYLKIAKQAFGDAWAEGFIQESPATKIKLMKKRDSTEKKTFTVEQFDSVLSHASGEWEGIILAGLYTGQRLSDIAAMQVAQLSHGWWRFKTRKTGAQMAVPLATTISDWMKKWLDERKIASKYVFPTSAASVEKNRASTLSNQFYRIMTAAGLVPKRNNKISKGIGRSGKRSTNEISFHSLRHTCTTWMKAQGVSEAVAMAFIGHESEAVNRSYTHLPEETLMEAMRQMEKFSVVRVA